MKYSELEGIAEAIISSNDRLIYLNLLVVVIALFCVYFTTVLKKSGELTAIKIAFDDIKEQNRVITTETENIKRQIEKGTIEFQIKLSKSHERKIEAIDIIYKSLASVYNESRKMLLVSDENVFEGFYKVVEGFGDTLESNKIWLDSSVCDDIENFAAQLAEQVRKYQGALTVANLPHPQQPLGEKCLIHTKTFMSLLFVSRKN